MRPSRTFALITAITLGSFLGLPRPAVGAPLPLVSYSSFWKYYAGAVGLPPDWAQTNFNDGAWPSGPGALGFPIDENLLGLATMQTMLPLSGSNGAPIIPYYFRTWFTLPTNALGVTLVSTNLLDDGAVIYLNGGEAGRIRMPAGVVTTNTLANSTSDISSLGPAVTNLATTNLVQGLNLLAVEVHQGAATSGDIAFALSLTAISPEKLVITEQPASQTVTVGSVASLTVSVTGTSPSYQWFRNGVAFPHDTNSTFAFVAFTTNQSADFFVVVTNVISSVTSEVARLTVMADTFPPTLVSAYEVLDTLPGVEVTFSEPLLRSSATNPASYRIIHEGSGMELTITNVAVAGDRVRLRVSSWQSGARYLLMVGDVQDRYSNTIVPNTCIAVGFWQAPVSINAEWRFQGMGWEPATNWQHLDHDDSTWPESRAPFYYDQDDLPVCAGPKATALTYGYNTYYFRIHFPLSETTGRGLLSLIAVVDDGAVFYLNGQEIWRGNMASGPVSYSTWASAPMDAACSTPVSLAVTNLVSGDNVLAVEVHQAQDPGFDVVFGAALTLVHQPELPSGAVLSVAREADGRLRLWWTGTSPVLQGAEAVDGPWQDVTNAAPAIVPPEGEARFFRLRRPIANP
jgi:hypothetical protein